MSKKILDLAGLQHYDEKIKSYIDSEVAGAKALDIKFETATEYTEDESVNEPVLGYIKYNKTGWTNDDVKATLKLNDNDYRIVNNFNTTVNELTYDEFIKVGDKMEFIGTTAIEIDGITTAEIDEMFTA